MNPTQPLSHCPFALRSARKVLPLSILLGISTGTGNSFADDLLTIRGELEVFAHPADTNGPAFITSKWEVRILDCAWTVLLHDIDYHHPRGGGPSRLEYAGDCDSYYHLREWPPEKMERTKARLLAEGKLDQLRKYKRYGGKDFTIRPGNFPRDLTLYPSTPWLAYCFGATFGATTSVSNIFTRFAWPASELKAAPVNPAHSQDVMFMEELKIFKPGVQVDTRSNDVLKNLPPPFDKGWVGLEQTVLEWRDARNLRIPARVKQTFFQLRMADDNYVREPTAIVFVASEVSLTEGIKSDLVLRPPPDAVIIDRR